MLLKVIKVKNYKREKKKYTQIYKDIKYCKKKTIEDDMKLNEKTSKRENTNSECYEKDSKKE